MKGHCKRLFYTNKMPEAIIAIMHMLCLNFNAINSIKRELFHVMFYQVYYLK